MSDPAAPPRPANWQPEWPWPLPGPLAEAFAAQFSAPAEPVPALPVAPIPHGPPLPPEPKPAPKAGTAFGIEEDGYARVQFGDGPEIRVDVCEAYWHLAAVYEDVEDEIPEAKAAARTAEYLKRVRVYLKELGAGEVSTRSADLFDKHLAALVDGTKKADAPAPTQG